MRKGAVQHRTVTFGKRACTAQYRMYCMVSTMLARVRLLANVRVGLCMHVSRHHYVEAPPCVQYARTVRKFSLKSALRIASQAG